MVVTEEQYYIEKDEFRNLTQAEYDIKKGLIRICAVPFVYRSVPLYRKAYEKCCNDLLCPEPPEYAKKETALLEKQILEDIDECEERYRKEGNLPEKYPWYLLKARVYCLKRLLQKGMIEGFFEGKNDSLFLDDVHRRAKSKDVCYVDYSLVDDNIISGKVKIYEIPFKYRSSYNYCRFWDFVRLGFPEHREAENRLFVKMLMDDMEECEKVFWSSGNYSDEDYSSRLQTRRFCLKKHLMHWVMVERSYCVR